MACAVTLAAIVTLGALLLVVVVDARHWEISPVWCLVTVGAALVLRVIEHPGGDLHAVVDALAGGIALGGMACFVWWLRPSTMGLGDLYLFPCCGVVAGLGMLFVWAIIHMVLALVCAMGFAWIRGRPPGWGLRKGHYPAALAACPAAAACLAFRVWWDQDTGLLLIS